MFLSRGKLYDLHEYKIKTYKKGLTMFYRHCKPIAFYFCVAHFIFCQFSYSSGKRACRSRRTSSIAVCRLYTSDMCPCRAPRKTYTFCAPSRRKSNKSYSRPCFLYRRYRLFLRYRLCRRKSCTYCPSRRRRRKYFCPCPRTWRTSLFRCRRNYCMYARPFRSNRRRAPRGCPYTPRSRTLCNRLQASPSARPRATIRRIFSISSYPISPIRFVFRQHFTACGLLCQAFFLIACFRYRLFGLPSPFCSLSI